MTSDTVTAAAAGTWTLGEALATWPPRAPAQRR